MANLHSDTGISIQRDRERTIPDVEVNFLPTATMINGVSYNAKDSMTIIWGNETGIAYSLEDQINQNFSRGTAYSRGLYTPSTSAPSSTQKLYGVSQNYVIGDADGPSNLSTQFVHSLTYLANSMILTPYTYPVNTYLTKNTTYTISSSDLNTYGQKVIVKGSANEAKGGTLNTWDSVISVPDGGTANAANYGAVSFVAAEPHLTDGSWQQTDRQDPSNSSQSKSQSPVAINSFKPTPPTGVAPWTDFFRTMISTFSLQKNQPFGINLTMNTPSTAWIEKMVSQESTLFNTGSGAGQTGDLYFIPQALRRNSVTFIEFGGGDGDQLVLVVYQQRGKIELYKNIGASSGSTQPDKKIGGKNDQNSAAQPPPASTQQNSGRVKIGEAEIKGSIDSDASNYQKMNLVIYPIGSDLVVCNGEDGLRLGAKGARSDSVAIFKNDRAFNITKGPIKITSYLGAATYSYSHVLHVSKGVFASPTVFIKPTGANSEPVISVDFEGRSGGGNVKGTGLFHFPMPGDKANQYDFLSDSTIEAEIRTAEGLSYKLTLVSNENDEGDEFKRIYSPRIYSVQAKIRPQTLTINIASNPIAKEDIIRTEVNQTCVGLSATVTLQNRKLSGDTIPKPGGKYDNRFFTGIKPIEIKYNLKGSRLEKKFVGYAVGQTFSLGGKGTKSEVTIKCEDVSIKAKNSYAINLPIFDGWCHLAAFYYLAKEAGYGDDEIVFDKTGGVQLATIIGQAGGDVTTMTGGCFDGHEGQIFQGQVIHAPLPLPNDKLKPFYMQVMGTPLWDCMEEIRKFSGFYMFANRNGQIVYAPPERVFANNAVGHGDTASFIEQGGQAINNNTLRFTEIQNQLNVEHRPINGKNSVYVFGYDTVGVSNTVGIGKPLVSIAGDTAWPFDSDTPNYVPWKAITILRNPMWNDQARCDFIANETFKRLNRPWVYISWTSFGQVGINAYDVITLDETLSAETGATGNGVVVTSITDTLDARNMSFFSSYEGEVVNAPVLTDPGSVPYHPQSKYLVY